MHIAFSTDGKFAPHAAATIASLLSNTLSERKINIYILHENMSDRTICDLKLLSNLRMNTYVIPIKIDASEFRSFPIYRGVRAFETYFRLKLPALLPEVDKIIYLDSDTIVCGDIEELWLKEIGENLILGVEVPTYLHKARFEELGMKPGSPYFNAGVLMMNLAKMRNSGLYGKVTALMEEKREVLKQQDQDILNILAEGQWQPLPLKYNAYWCVLDRPGKNKFIYYEKEDLKEAKENPFIIHFNGFLRTWEPGCIHPKTNLYWKYRDLTAFKCPRPPLGKHIIKLLINKALHFRRKYLYQTGIVVKLLALHRLILSKVKA